MVGNDCVYVENGRIPMTENSICRDCHTFQAYLRQIGKASMWSERIFPGMQRALIGTMLASQDTMDRRPNTFELYGADFMISEDCQPWLVIKKMNSTTTTFLCLEIKLI